MPLRYYIHTFLTLSLVLVPCFKPSAEPWQTSQFLQRSFIEIALKNEFDSSSMQVRKWRKPLNIYLDHQVPQNDLHTRLVSMHIKHLANITQHPIHLVSNRTSANVILVFTDQAHWQHEVIKLLGAHAAQRINTAVCLAGFNVNKSNEIEKAGIIIPVDQAQMQRKLVSCIVEETTQIMGLPNDSDQVFPSIFNDKTPQDLLSGLDGLLLKMLYHPSIKAGMSEAQATPILEKIITEWQQDGTITQADKMIQQGELYSLMGY